MPKVKLSDHITEILVDNNITTVFGIIGSANAHIFDSLYFHPKINLICMHHEQACVMAAHGYYMQSGKIAAVIATAGAGTTNLLTGVVGAWADSVPILIITGQEATKQFKNKNISRMIGIQGVNTESIFKSCTKRVITCHSPEIAIKEIEISIELIKTGRYGPSIIDIPIDVQGSKINPKDNLFEKNYPIKKEEAFLDLKSKDIDLIISGLNKSTKPILWLGNGLRGMDSEKLRNIILKLNIPYLTSWTANDLINPIDNLYAGHAGTYGSRVGNLMLQSSDFVLTLGTRLAIPQKGYVDEELAREASIYVIDIDKKELDKLGKRFENKFQYDAKIFLKKLSEKSKDLHKSFNFWLDHLHKLKEIYPNLENCHLDNSADDFVNSYFFISRLGSEAKPNTTFVTDMGTALISAFQILTPRQGQKLFSSQGLGEMGYGLPGAIGAWFANKTREIICLNCDGGLMMNIQDLQTVIHNEIPLKIIIFNNDGYLMIKHTQDAIVNGRRAGTDKKSGLSCPNYEKIASAFGFNYLSIKNKKNTDNIISQFYSSEGPTFLEIFMPINQPLVPKLSVNLSKNGTLISPPLEDLKPFISLRELKKNLLTEIHKNSYDINRKSD